jgi:hypothetical protein
VAPVVAPPAEGISVVEVTPVKVPAEIVGGQRRARGRVKVVLKNEGTAAAAGPVTVTLLASADAAPSPDVDLTLGTLTRAVRLKPGASRTLSIRVRFPAPATTGDYVLLASAAGPAVSTKNLAQGAATVHIDLPAVQLVPGAGDGTTPGPLAVKLGGRTVLTIPVTNQGNIPLTDPLDVELRVSTDGTLVNSLPLITLDDIRLPVRAGATRPMKLAFDLPALPTGVIAGSYTLLVKLAGSDQVLASIPFTIS